MREMEKNNAANQDELPFMEPEQISPLPTNRKQRNAVESIPDPLVPLDPGASELSVLPFQDQSSHMKEPSASLFFDYLQQGMESLKGLNLEGFLQIYPVFLAIFGTFLLELTLSLLANLIHSINQLPLFGGVLQGISELVGLVALVCFVSKNLLLQRKRAELFTRIAVLKKVFLVRSFQIHQPLKG